MSGEAWFGENVPCGRGPDECKGTAEPEEDGEARYYKCTAPDCGFEFGYEIVSEPAQGDCQLGIPEETRKLIGTASVSHGPLPGGAGVTFLGSNITVRRAE